jgi:hypothetical protein
MLQLVPVSIYNLFMPVLTSLDAGLFADLASIFISIVIIVYVFPPSHIHNILYSIYLMTSSL